MARWSTSSRTASFQRRCFSCSATSRSAKRRDRCSQLGGFGWSNPRLRGALCIAALAALGLPGLAGFAASSDLDRRLSTGYVWPAIVALVAIVLASAYMLRLYQGIMNGPQRRGLARAAGSHVDRRPRRRAVAGRARRWLASIPNRSWQRGYHRAKRTAPMTISFTQRRLERDCAHRRRSRQPASSCCSPISLPGAAARYVSIIIALLGVLVAAVVAGKAVRPRVRCVLRRFHDRRIRDGLSKRSC